MVTSLYPETWDLISFFNLALITTFTACHRIIQLTLKFSYKIEHFGVLWLYQFLWTYNSVAGGLLKLEFGNLRRSCWRNLKGVSGMRTLWVHLALVPAKNTVLPGSYLVNWDFVVMRARSWIHCMSVPRPWAVPLNCCQQIPIIYQEYH